MIPGAPAWALPIARCPLDHLLNPAEFVPSTEPHVREWSFLLNPRTPTSLLSSVAATQLDAAGGPTELARLRGLSGARVINLTNLPAASRAVWAGRADALGRVGRADPSSASLLSAAE